MDKENFVAKEKSVGSDTDDRNDSYEKNERKANCSINEPALTESCDYLSTESEKFKKITAVTKNMPFFVETGIPVSNFTPFSENKYFGTDGFRGVAGDTLSSEQAYRIGRFLGWYFSSARSSGRGRIVVGKDTRRSGYMLEYSIIAGIISSGADAYMLHVITTPAVSYITESGGFDCGIMITASHNPYRDNGIKLIDSRGEKMGDGVVKMIEDYLDGRADGLMAEGCDLPFARGEDIGVIVDCDEGRERYAERLKSLAACSLRPLKIGLDCANGAAWSIAQTVFAPLGAELHLTGCEPDGVNINRGVGSTCIDNLRSLVLNRRLDVGFAFDGDGDRCIAVDSSGNTVDGDGILYILARRLKRLGELTGDRIAVTVMSNAGLIEALKNDNVGCEITQVGDRFVYEKMQSEGLALGGESSGHVILNRYATTGDGILTALMIVKEMLDQGKTLSELVSGLHIYPQITENLTVKDRDAVIADRNVGEVRDKISAELCDRGKILIRKSGTEPVIRVSVECESEERCKEYVMQIKRAIKAGGHMDD